MELDCELHVSSLPTNKGKSYLECKYIPCSAKWKWPKPTTPKAVTPLQDSFKHHCWELMIQVQCICDATTIDAKVGDGVQTRFTPGMSF